MSDTTSVVVGELVNDVSRQCLSPVWGQVTSDTSAEEIQRKLVYCIGKFNSDDFQHDPRAEYARCPFTEHMTGDCEWGGWNRAGRVQFRAIRTMIVEGCQEETTTNIERDALQRIRIAQNLEGENARVPGRRRRRRVRDDDETEGESDDDMADL